MMTRFRNSVPQMRLVFLGTTLGFLALAGCSSYEAQVGRLETFAGFGQVGSSRDVWMEKFNFAGEWEKTALIFGYADDYEACNNMVAAWKAQYPLDTYRCNTAN